jgi:hypothetical protein
VAKKIYGFTKKSVRDKLSAWAESLGPPFTNERRVPEPPAQQTRVFQATVKTAVTAATGGKAGYNYKVGTGEVYLLQRAGLQLKFWFHPNTINKLERTVYNACPIPYPVDSNTVLTIAQDRRGDFWVIKECEQGSFSSSISSSSVTETSTDSSCSTSSESSCSTSSDSSSSTSSATESSGCFCTWSYVESQLDWIPGGNCPSCDQECDPNSKPGFAGVDGDVFPGYCKDLSVSSSSPISESSVSSCSTSSDQSVSSGDDCACDWIWDGASWSINDDNCSDCGEDCDPTTEPAFPGTFVGEIFPGGCTEPI